MPEPMPESMPEPMTKVPQGQGDGGEVKPEVLPIDRIPLRSDKGIDYTKLRDLLRTQQWQAADQETLNVMMKAANRVGKGWFSGASLKHFPCQDLNTIDQLWVIASNGHFGFSVQEKIWAECSSPTCSNQDWDRFRVRVGWAHGATAYVSYLHLKFDLQESPAGELPVGRITFHGLNWHGVYAGGGGLFHFLVQRLIKCGASQL